MLNRSIQVAIAIVAATMCAHAQYLNYRAPGTPRMRDGKPNLSAPAPRASNGKPDLSGIWQAEGAPLPELLKYEPDGINGLGEDPPSQYFFNVLSNFRPDEAPLQPAVLQRQKEQAAKPPASLCLPPSVPLVHTVPAPFKIVQTPALIMMLYEVETSFRQIYLDGRKHPSDPQPTWLGYSIGRWEGDTLVVDVAGLNNRSPLDAMGHPHSDAMHVTERFHRLDFGHMNVEITIDDPKTFTQPFTYTVKERLRPDTDLIEYFCIEDEHDSPHMRGQ
jgi:hypothetical protein